MVTEGVEVGMSVDEIVKKLEELGLQVTLEEGNLIAELVKKARLGEDTESSKLDKILNLLETMDQRNRSLGK